MINQIYGFSTAYQMGTSATRRGIFIARRKELITYVSTFVKRNDNLMAKFRSQKSIFFHEKRVRNLPKARQKPKATMMVSTMKEILEKQFLEFRNWAMWLLYRRTSGLKSRGNHIDSKIGSSSKLNKQNH